MPNLKITILGVVLAIAITATMDANGLSVFSALPLFPLMGLFWVVQRMSRREVGFTWGEWRYHVLAVLYPLLVLGLTGLIAWAGGAMDLSQTEWRKTGLNFVLVTFSTLLATIITEEGFFRGWLWASLKRVYPQEKQVLLWSTLAFLLWHVSPVTLETGFDLPVRQVPVYLINVGLIGAIWGLLRWMSGSVIVASVSHGLWNGGAYVLFGFGEKVGALGIGQTSIYGPEVGVLGIVLNGLMLVALWSWWAGRSRGGDSGPTERE